MFISTCEPASLGKLREQLEREQDAWTVLIDAAQRSHHGEAGRDRLRSAAIAYADAVQSKK